MAATLLTKFTAVGSYGDYWTLGTEANPAETAADVANGNGFACSGNDLVIAHATAGAQTITIASSPDPWGRVKDITTYAMGANDIAVFGPFKTDGWATGGVVFLTATAAVNLTVVQMNPQ